MNKNIQISVNDHGDAKFVDFHMIPSSGPVGTEFIIDCSFKSLNGTGPGMLTIVIDTPQNQSASNDFLLDAKPPGLYDQRIAVKTLSTFCDPPNGKDHRFHLQYQALFHVYIFLIESCNGFPTGTFNVTAYLCKGECGSQHPHSSIYDVGFTSFVVNPKEILSLD